MNMNSNSTPRAEIHHAWSAAAPGAVERILAQVQHLASFCAGTEGGNPAGVWLGLQMPAADLMQHVAAAIGYSETVFAVPDGAAWQIRYFSPESEVPFCGHATIALGAALAQAHGEGEFALHLLASGERITVEGRLQHGVQTAVLQSPPTRSGAADADFVEQALALFGYTPEDLDMRIPPALAFAGAHHLILALKSRDTLAAMHYDLDSGRRLMRGAGLATIALIYARSDNAFDARNPFASGGVYEDPATGAAAAALAGYLRDLNWPHGGSIEIVQGEDMGARSLIRAELTDIPGASIRVSGAVRELAV